MWFLSLWLVGGMWKHLEKQAGEGLECCQQCLWVILVALGRSECQGVCTVKAVLGSQVGTVTLLCMSYLEGNVPPSCPSTKTQLAEIQIFAGRRLETGFLCGVQAGLELLPQNPPLSASQRAGIAGMSYHGWDSVAAFSQFSREK